MATEDATNSLLEKSWVSRKPLQLVALAFALALLWERLFYARPMGVSFPLWLGLALLAGSLWAFYEKGGLSRSALFLSLAIFGLSLIIPWRLEPLTNFLAVVLPLSLALVWLRLLNPGGLLRWGWLDYLVAALLVPIEGLLRPWPNLGQAQRELTRGESWSTRLLAVLRGLLLALPVIIIFLVLLSAADLIFEEWVDTALAWLNLERLFDILARGLVVLLLTIYLVGLMAAGLRRKETEGLVRQGQPLLAPFLGMTEASIVLASVDGIFGLFVLIQFRYFFGGETNISAAGYTYAEYARRGFGELVAVSFLTLGLILLLANWTRQKSRTERRWFRGLSAAAVGLIGVMLVSAMIRLNLYERAFGFTRLRTYTHVAIILLGLLFATFLVLLFLGNLKRFVLACLLGAIGFTAALALVNVDQLIVERNFEHLQEIGELDGWYLTTLSDDAVPAIVANLPDVPSEELSVVMAGLSCRQYQLERRAERTGWPSFRFPHQRAIQALSSIEAKLKQYPLDQENGYSQVKIGPEEYFYCYDFAYFR